MRGAGVNLCNVFLVSYEEPQRQKGFKLSKPRANLMCAKVTF